MAAISVRLEQGQRQGLSRREDFLPSSLWAESPFGLMRRFSEEMDQLFGDVFADFGTARRRLAPRVGHGFGFSQAQWVPRKDDVKVEVTDDLLTVEGERREEREEETREGYCHSERRYGRFSRSVPLPEGINPEDVRCTSRTGARDNDAGAAARTANPTD